MTVHVYIPETEKHTKGTYHDSVGWFIAFNYTTPYSVNFSKQPAITLVTWHDQFWYSTYELAAGLYEGEGFSVKIAVDWTTQGNGPDQKTARQVTIKGTFKTLELAKSFEYELFYGGLGPTTPFIGHPDASALRAAKNAALVVSTRAELAELDSKYHMALNQLTAQGNHIQELLLAVAKLKGQMKDVVDLTVLNNDAFSAHIAQTHTDGFFLKTKR